MPTITENITKQFLQKLSDSDDVPAEMIAALGDLLSGRAKIKPDQFVAIFAPPEEGDVE